MHQNVIKMSKEFQCARTFGNHSKSFFLIKKNNTILVSMKVFISRDDWPLRGRPSSQRAFWKGKSQSIHMV